MDEKRYLRLSKRTGRQMTRITKAGSRLENAIQNGIRSGKDRMLIDAAISAGRKIGGSPGDGAIEIYRDLDMNIEVADEFLSEWRSYSKHPTVSAFSVVRRELEALRNMVVEAGPSAMSEMTDRLSNQRHITEADIYDFKGSNMVMLLTFIVVICLKYFDVLTWSWLVVIPVGIGAMVLVASIVSIVLRLK